MTHENLIPQSERTKEEQRDIASMGGHASVAARRKKRDLKAKIAATWEIMTTMKKNELKKALAKSSPDSPEYEILKSQQEILEQGGAEMLLTMLAITAQNTSSGTKLMGINMLLDHEHGRPKQKTELSGEDGAPLIMRQIIDDIPTAKKLADDTATN